MVEAAKAMGSMALIVVILLSGVLGQVIPPSAFDITGVSSSPPPPPPPPPSSGNLTVAFDGVHSPPPPSTPAPSSVPASSSATPAIQSTKQSSGLSGGAIAGIVIGVVAGLAIAALLALLVLRKRRSRLNDVETDQFGDKAKLSSVVLPPKSSNMHNHLGSLNARPSGLDWMEGDEIKSTTNLPNQSSQASRIEESLSDIASPRPGYLSEGAPASSSAVQILPDLTSVIVTRGPGGAVHIQKVTSNGPKSAGQFNSHASVLSTASSGAVTIGSKTSGASSLVDLPDLPWSDWQLKADDIIFATDAGGEKVRLGAGAYGTVYKATIDGVTECACKVFHDVHNSLQQADILREVAILKSCRDRNIVQFLGACIMDERIMLVTELMEAGDLWQALQQYKESGALSWYRRGKRIAVEVARGLHFLHKHRIIHFDLKSPNVLLTRDGTAKISDVGFANILSNTHLSNNTTAFTFAWAAPEVLMGRQATDKVDIFSYGVLLWEIVTGLHPARGQLRDCIVPDECPAEVESLIQQCLSYEPTERPSCKEIVDILTKVEHLSAPASPASTVPAPSSASH